MAQVKAKDWRKKSKSRSSARPRLWRGLRAWGRDGRLVGALLALVSSLVLGYLLFSPTFQISEVGIQGNLALPQDEALRQSSIELGRNLFLLDVSLVRQRLEQIPYIQQVRVDRILPNQVRVRIWEKFPSVSWAPDNSLERYLVDDDGLVLGIEQEGMDQLIYIVDKEGVAVEVGEYVDVEAVQTAQQVFTRLYNDLGFTLLPFEYHSERGITAVSVDGWRACFGNGAHLEQKVLNLLTLLQNGIFFSEVDLRLPEQIRYR
ncbi:MAG: FtsQ-type POTRA domain-containing protein [Chloroflexia bacterium]|nr:FtsQ-type POTRA domain-containing protein [Chloroflexia bacterium]